MMWFWHDSRYLHSCNRIESLEINPYIYINSFLIRVPIQLNGKQTVFSHSEESLNTSGKKRKNTTEICLMVINRNHCHKIIEN